MPTFGRSWPSTWFADWIPGVSTLYVQSDLPEIAELYLLLGMNAYGGGERCTSFKEKIRKQPTTSTPTAHLSGAHGGRYPHPPRGESAGRKGTRTTLEMARTFGNRFNRLYPL